MAEDLERLIVQLEASLTKYERELRRAPGIADREARAVEKRFKSMNDRLNASTANLGRQLVPSLGAIGAALSVREVARYADAWTRAKNSLAVAGVTGAAQAKVLETLYQSAQRNAAPINALAELFGKASQAQAELGASQSDLITFTDGVATALRVEGKSAQEASGALMQLGQLLGSTRVMAEEFNSINEGARPILIAVANGLDAAGGSVSKLKQLINDGKVSNKQFFDAFMRGMPVIQSMAANATQTLEQGYTKVTNALTRYIGMQDQSLGATAVLSKALNALADDFDNVADVTLKLAALIAAALVGRAIGGMVASLGVASQAVLRYVAALRVGAGAVAAFKAAGMAGAMGPIGAVLGVAAAAALYFGTRVTEMDQAAQRGSDSLRELGISASSTADQIRKAAEELAKLSGAEIRVRMADNSALITSRYQQMRDMTLPGTAQVGRGKVFNPITDEYRRLVELFTSGRMSLEQFRSGLDGLAAKAPQAAKQFAEAQQAAEDYAAALKARAAQDKALAQSVSGSPTSPPRRAAEDASMAALDRDRAETAEFLRKRDEEERRTEREKEIEKRADEIAKALEKAGKLIDRAAIRAQATLEVDRDFGRKQTESFTGDAIKDYVDRVVKAESGGRADAKNPNSSATGLGQFIESTWLNLFKKLYPEQAATMGRAAILDLRKNGEISKNLIEAYAKENAAALQNAGQAVTEANLHLAHFLGPGGAIATLRAPAGASTSSFLGADQINANKSILQGKTREDVLAYADRRANATRIQAGDLTTAEKQAKDFTETLADSDRRTEALKLETEAIGKLTYAREFAAEKARLLADIEREGVKATPEQIAQIDAKAAAYARQAESQEKVKLSAESIADAQNFFAENATSAFTDIITGAATAEQAMRKLASSILEAVIQATLLGKGPLAGIFGTAASGDGPGGLIGSLFKAFTFAEGGVMTSNGPRALQKFARGGTSRTAAIFGEAGAEAAVPLPDGRRIPVDLDMRAAPTRFSRPDGLAARGGGSISVKTQIDLTGANGDETIRRIAYEEAQKGTAAGLKAYDRNFNNRINYANTYER